MEHGKAVYLPKGRVLRRLREELEGLPKKGGQDPLCPDFSFATLTTF
jgi:hypothetical protein